MTLFPVLSFTSSIHVDLCSLLKVSRIVNELFDVIKSVKCVIFVCVIYTFPVLNSVNRKYQHK